VAEAIQQKFDDLDYVHEIGELDLNLSGCMNSCGHHHVGHIGILGVDKAGEEWYQITLGGRQSGALKAGVKSNTDSNASAAIGRVIGPSFAREQVPDVIARLIQTYLSIRESDVERFIDVVDRVGIEPFKKDVYMDPLLAKTSNLVRESNV
jgi:sulfite reductase (NADPH) hemoprotein beta-component